ncbi:37965_t:CDS:2, partial [Gigaspora margarita]
NENFKKAYEDIYNSSDPNNPNSDTFLVAVLELIFDENYLNAKLDSNVVDK